LDTNGDTEVTGIFIEGMENVGVVVGDPVGEDLICIIDMASKARLRRHDKFILKYIERLPVWKTFFSCKVTNPIKKNERMNTMIDAQ
jgi:hypothetical protein